ncbi:DNA-3-methyladenine glycosylase I [Candidatus Binatia bacterium]|nr:DNA-3-methyladenine glycosylase I [Candidatus Binatia bacterium]
MEHRVEADDGRTRCPWAGSAPHMVAYHDEEWGVPLRDERGLFEFLILEGAQAGLSWATILARRDGYRRALHGFDAARIARYGARDEARLLADPGIIRNRAKVAATIGNARAFLEVQETQGSFATYLWSFVDGEPVRNRFRSVRDVPVSTPQSDAMSKDLKKRGFKFVGTTICYALMQATGMVNDHLVACFRHGEV